MRQWSEASKLSTCDCEAGVENSSATVARVTFRRLARINVAYCLWIVMIWQI
jgi:hypothetical protein